MHKATQDQGSDVDLELRRALEQVSIIGTALRDIQRHYQDQVSESATNVWGGVMVLSRFLPAHARRGYHPGVNETRMACLRYRA